MKQEYIQTVCPSCGEPRSYIKEERHCPRCGYSRTEGRVFKAILVLATAVMFLYILAMSVLNP